MEPESLVIIRSSKPTLLDQAPKGTLCKVSTPFAPEWELYKQVASNSNYPCWEFIGTVRKDSKDSVVPFSSNLPD